MSNWRGPLVAVIVLALLVGFYLLWEPADQAEAPDVEEDIFVTSLDWEGLRAVSVRWGDEPELRIELGEDGVYRLTSPASRPADQDRARLLFKTAAELRANRIIAGEEEADPTDYGLDSPDRHIVMETVDGEEIVVEVGDASPIVLDEYTSRYARVDGAGDIYLVAGIRLDFFTAPFERWRDAAIIHIDDVVRATVVASRGTWTAEKVGGIFEWELVEPYSVPAPISTMEQFVREIRNLRAREFVDDEPSREQLEEWDLVDGVNRVTLANARGDEVTLIIGRFVDSQGSESYVRREDEDSVYISSTRFYSAPGFTDVTEWVEPSPLSVIGREDILAVEVERPGATVRLVRGEDSWILEGIDGAEHSHERATVNMLIDRLRRISTRDVIWPDEEGAHDAMEDVAGRITISYEHPDGEREISLEVANPSPGSDRVHARVEGYAVVYVFPEELAGYLDLSETLESLAE